MRKIKHLTLALFAIDSFVVAALFHLGMTREAEMALESMPLVFIVMIPMMQLSFEAESILPIVVFSELTLLPTTIITYIIFHYFSPIISLNGPIIAGVKAITVFVSMFTTAYLMRPLENWMKAELETEPNGVPRSDQ